MKIDSIEARSIPDTRKRPTVETTLRMGDIEVSASVPSGKSTGSHEAKELRDTDGGVATAIAHVNGEIAHALKGKEFASPEEIDDILLELDGTPDKSRLGANAVLSVSIAAERLAAAERGIPLWKSIAERAGTEPAAPRLFANVLNGGVHADFRLPFQEYILVAEGNTSEALASVQRAFEALGATLQELRLEAPMGDEGGYSPKLGKLDEPFELLAKLVQEDARLSIAIDSAANELREENGYKLLDRHYSAEQLLSAYENLSSKFPIHSIEDAFSEDADEDFIALTRTIGSSVVIIGDDFTVTNPARIEKAAGEKAINGVLIKPNQIGSVKEAIAAVQKTHEHGWKAVCSHRSGETHDTFIADFAYGLGAHGLKAGGLGQKERREKYERLLEIEGEID